jgi:uncharacterized membrane protein YqiK
MKNVSPSRLLQFLKPATVILIILGILAVIFLGTSFYIVDQTEEIGRASCRERVFLSV